MLQISYGIDVCARAESLMFICDIYNKSQGCAILTERKARLF